MKINDIRLYLYFSIITLVIGIVLGAVSYYSILVVEPRAQNLINSQGNVNQNFRIAYGILRNPQLFARFGDLSDVGRNSMVFFLLLSLLGAGFLIVEKRKVKAQGQ